MNPPKSLEEFGREQLHSLVTAFRTQLDQAAEQPGTEQIHDLRVSIRKLEQGLSLFGSFLSGKKGQTLARQLRKLLDITSQMRNRDLAIQFAEQQKLARPRLLRTFHREREAGSTELVREIRKLRVRTL